MSGIKISVVIPTLNRPQGLTKLILKLLNFCSSEVEILIVDDSTESWEIPDFHLKRGQLAYFHRGIRMGVSSARNYGASLSNGEYLLFLDDDDDFENNWINDFLKVSAENPDLIFCNMIRIEPNGERREVKISDNRNGAMGNRIVIPGAWMIKKSLFERIQGYDDRILFAENTEFFFRVFNEQPSVIYLDQFNFIYHPSPSGGSKNLQNMIDSLTLILEKHAETLTPHVKHLYHQIIGVNWIRFRNFPQARHHLFQAVKYHPTKLATWGRLCLAFFPFIARRLYSETVNHG